MEIESENSASRMYDAMFLPDWSRPHDIRVELSVVNMGGCRSSEATVWSQRFDDVEAMSNFWDFVCGHDDAWPFMAMIARRQGPSTLTDMLRRLGAPLPEDC